MTADKAKTRERCGYITLKISPESYDVVAEVKHSKFWFHVYLKDIIAITWPRCPDCSGPLVQKFASGNLLCARCGAEFRLEYV